MRSEEVKKRNLAITSMSAMLLATVTISMITTTTTDNAFAGNKMYASGVIQAAASSSSSKTGTPQEACEECFNGLSSDQQDTIVERVGGQFFTENPPTTLEEFCADLLDLDVEEQGEAFRDIINILEDIGVDEDTRTSIIRCLTSPL
jgi:hypothetical protein